MRRNQCPENVTINGITSDLLWFYDGQQGVLKGRGAVSRESTCRTAVKDPKAFFVCVCVLCWCRCCLMIIMRACSLSLLHSDSISVSVSVPRYATLIAHYAAIKQLSQLLPVWQHYNRNYYSATHTRMPGGRVWPGYWNEFHRQYLHMPKSPQVQYAVRSARPLYYPSHFSYPSATAFPPCQAST